MVPAVKDAHYNDARRAVRRDALPAAYGWADYGVAGAGKTTPWPGAAFASLEFVGTRTGHFAAGCSLSVGAPSVSSVPVFTLIYGHVLTFHARSSVISTTRPFFSIARECMTGTPIDLGRKWDFGGECRPFSLHLFLDKRLLHYG